MSQNDTMEDKRMSKMVGMCCSMSMFDEIRGKKCSVLVSSPAEIFRVGTLSPIFTQGKLLNLIFFG